MTTTTTAHRLITEEDRCACGGLVVWWDDPDRDGYVGEGCEIGGVWPHLRKQAECALCGDALDGEGVRMRDPKVWQRNPLAYSPAHHVHRGCGDDEDWIVA